MLAQGFVGRRRQFQTSLGALKQDVDKVGVLLLGTGGLGKSCLAGKICDSLGCGREETAVEKAGELVDYFDGRLEFQKSR